MIDQRTKNPTYNTLRRKREDKETAKFGGAITRNNNRKVKKHKPAVKPVIDWKQEVRYVPGMKQGFYSTKEWRYVRWQVLDKSGSCALCGRSKKHGVVMHVDHIKPRSKYPELELTLSNLQVLCEDCNLGKGAKIATRQY